MRELFAQMLIAQGSQTAESVEGLVKKHFTVLEQAFASLKPEEDFEPPVPEPAPPGAAAQTRKRLSRSSGCERSTTRCRRHPQDSRFTRSSSADASGARRCSNNPTERTIDWSTAEELAFATHPRRRRADPADR